MPELYRIVKIQNDINEKERVKELPKYDYPMHVLTAAKAQWFTKYGVAFSVNPKSCTRISELDSQKAVGKAIFGGGCSCQIMQRQKEQRQKEQRQKEQRQKEQRHISGPCQTANVPWLNI